MNKVAVVDQQKTPLPHQRALELLEKACRLSGLPDMIHKFHSTRPMAQDYKSEVLPYILRISNQKEESNTLRDILSADSYLLRLVGLRVRVRPMRLKRQPLAVSLQQSASKLLAATAWKEKEGREGGERSASQQGTGAGPQPVLQPLQLYLSNPHNLCYSNAVFIGLRWVGRPLSTSMAHEPSMALGRLQPLLSMLHRGTQHRPIYTPNLLGFQLIFQHFPRFREQHDACEFLHHCLQYAQAEEGLRRWEARRRTPQQVEVFDHGTLNQPIPLHLNGHSLQGLVDDWQHQHRMHGLVQPTQCLYLQICRYDSQSGTKSLHPITITPGTQILMPIFEHSQDTAGLLIPYKLLFVIAHEGESVNPGHYRCVISAGDNFIITNDASRNALLPPQRYDWLAQNCYLIGLIRD